MSKHRNFLRIAEAQAYMSPDPSTKVGCVIVSSDRIVAYGFNHIPSPIQYTETQLQNREWKYPRVIHAEMDALAKIGPHNFSYPILYVTHFPCAQCAISIVHAGIKEIYTRKVPVDMIERWGASMKLASEILTEGGVFVNYLDGP